MYLHIGENKMVDVRRIVAMFKAHPTKTEKSNPLQQYYKKLILLDHTEGKAVKCYIVTEDCVYGTVISLETIIQRYRRLFASKGR